MKSVILLSSIVLVFNSFPGFSTNPVKDDTSRLQEKTFSGLEFRSIGPAFMSGRIADVAIHPEHQHTWYVAVGSGGVWKTTNAGTTWKPVFDNQKVYSIGCVTIDPSNPNVIWVGTGENIGGRHVGFGDGIYRSDNAGASWKNMGLKSSQHISKILVHPENSDIIWVAAQGPLWNSGGDRGASWEKRSEAVSGATGPHYYQELYASPHQFDKIYLADVRVQVSEDGGKTFKRMEEQKKHSDNHVIVFREDDPEYLLVGTDGGLYETFDDTKSWRFVDNLPLTQYYKVAVDDAEPFYNVYGGTQDNGTHGGPSRTDNL